MIKLTDQPIDTTAALQAVQTKQSGAVVMFLGITREFTGTLQTVRLKYDAYAEMAVRKLEQIEQEANQRWKLNDSHVIHRLGVVELSEASVLVAVGSAHRRDAFEAAMWIMDKIKQEVPIWKQEHWADGTVEWVHPGVQP